jgi:hypothetical protein
MTELSQKLRRISTCVYLAAEETVADDIAKACRAGAAAIDESEQLRRALAVLVTTPHIADYLTNNDPKALGQARAALGTCQDCGQGPALTYAYEHKSTCQWWRDHGDLED